MKKIIILTFLCIMGIQIADAQTIADVGNAILAQIHSVPNLAYGFSYLCGIGLGIKAGLKFKEHHDSQGQIKLHVPILYAIGSALLLTIPTVMNTGISSFGFDQAAQKPFKY